jgi:hypothetical protein
MPSKECFIVVADRLTLKCNKTSIASKRKATKTMVYTALHAW